MEARLAAGDVSAETIARNLEVIWDVRIEVKALMIMRREALVIRL